MKPATAAEILSLIPQQKPFRFVDEILEMDEDHILGAYTWTEEDCQGFGASKPIVPVFKLIEMSAQIGIVSWCMYHMSLKTPLEEIRLLVGFFTQIEHGECVKLVRPGDNVACFASFGDEGYYRSNKLVSRVEMQFNGGPKDGQEIFSGLISGVWMPKSAAAAL